MSGAGREAGSGRASLSSLCRRRGGDRVGRDKGGRRGFPGKGKGLVTYRAPIVGNQTGAIPKDERLIQLLGVVNRGGNTQQANGVE